MKSTYLLLSFIFIISSFQTISAQIKIKSGLVLSGGISWLNLDRSTDVPTFDGYPLFGMTNPNKKISGQAGYQFQIDLPYKLQVETGIFGQAKFLTVNYSSKEQGANESEYNVFGASAQGVLNYKIIKGLKLGLGIEPTLYWGNMYNNHSKNSDGSKFDCPLLIRAGYDLKKIGFAITYKNGFTNLYKNPYVYKAKDRDLLFSIFIPFH